MEDNRTEEDMAPDMQPEGTPELSVEESFARLQEIIARMGSEEITLEESFACYEEGVKLVKNCSAQLDGVEKKVMKLKEDGSLAEFDV